VARHADEDEELRSVALQNAQSIHLARQRAEEALQRTRAALESRTQELAQSLALMRATLESTTDGILATDADGRITTCNERFGVMWPVAPELLERRDLRAVMQANSRFFDDPASFLARVEEIRASAAPETHDVLRLSDGRVFERFTQVQQLDGRNVGRVWSLRDVTEHHRAVQAMEQSSLELADFFENASVGLHWAGPDGTILRVNRAELDLLGYEREDYVGHRISEFHVDQAVIADILERLRAGEVLRDREVRMRCRNGEIKHVLLDSSVLWKDGEFIHTRCFTRDLSDRARASEAQSRLAAIVESSEDAIIGKTLDSRIMTWNAGAQRLFGYTAEEIVGQSITLLIPADRQDEERQILEQVRRGERLEHYDTVRIARDGRLIDVSLTVSPVLDAAGQVVAASSIARDITASKRAEEALRASEQRFRLLAKTIPSMIWTAAPDGTITYANDRWFEYCGLTPSHSGDDWPELVVHPDDRERCREAWSRARRDGTEYAIEVRHRRYDGAYRWFVTRAVPLRDDAERVEQWFGITTDIEDRKRAEQTSHFLAEVSTSLSELTDDEGTLSRVARIAVTDFADWCRVDLQQVDGSLRTLALTHRDPQREQFALTLAQRYAARATDAHWPMRVVKTGEPEWIPRVNDQLLQELARDDEHLRLIRELGLVSVISVPLKSRHRTLGALTFATAESGRIYDTSDLTAAEDLAHRTVIAMENANLLKALQGSDRRKDEFLAMLAHELRNPLAPIRNAVQIFRVKSPPVPELRWATEVIDRQAEQMARLVDDLMDVSRITRGNIELRREIVDLRRVVNTALEASRPLIEKWNHAMTVTMPDEPVWLDADPTRLAQVLLNLVNNSAKYTEHGGNIALSVRRRGDEALITVSDDGIGIPQEMLPRIFDMFTQLDRSRERSEGGLGIGLTLVQRLVEMHGGVVEARSEGEGKGSEFVVRIPVAADASHQPPGVPGTPLSPRPRRILVVDDNRDAAHTLAKLLSMLGNDVTTAHDGVEAVGAAATFRPDVVLLDLGLPRLNGYDVARKIRAQEGGSGILLVALTGWGQARDRERTGAAGFDHHMTKPVEFDVLLELLHEAPDRKETDPA
jgi:PAS domain S-box-containing protein